MKILMFSAFELPDSCANATRALNFAKLLKNLGNDVDSLGICYSSENHLCGKYDGVEYEMVRAMPFYGIKSYKRVKKLQIEITSFLNKKSIDGPYDVIILSNVYYDFSKLFVSYAKKFGSKVVVNSVEWYEKDNVQFDGLLGKVNYIKNRIALKKIHVKMGNIIAISSLLEEYYKARGCNTVRIPTIIDTKEYDAVSSTERKYNQKLHIAYAGNPGRKDYVINALYALDLLNEHERERVCFDFYGPTTEQLVAGGLSEEFLEKHRSQILCHGRIPYVEVKRRIAEADFTVLLRPNLRYANAGFPTKVGESMACGTPVICNLTSDLGKYVLDGKTGVVCKNETPEGCADALRRALSFTTEERAAMSRACLEMSDAAFDFSVYGNAVDGFLKRLI